MLKNNLKPVLLGILIGIAGSVSAVVYSLILKYAEEIMFFGGFLAKKGFCSGILYFIILALLGIITARLLKHEPYIGGSGIPQIEAEYHGHITQKWYRVLTCKIIGGTLCILGGLSLGREGPSIQLGGMAGKGIANRVTKDEKERRRLMTCGASAGLAAAFNAPLAGVMFSLEEVHKGFSPSLLATLMVSSFTADFVSKLVFGQNPVFSFAINGVLPLRLYPVIILLGILLGLFGALYNFMIPLMQKVFGKIPVYLRIVIPFLIAGVLMFILPDVLGGGHRMIELLYDGNLTLKLMILLLIVKFLFSAISFGSGAPGGIFFPLLVLGAFAGGIFTFTGFCDGYTFNIVSIAMAGFFASIVQAPLTGIILICEMTGFCDILPLVTVSATAYITARICKSEPIYDILLKNLLKKQEN